MKMVGSHYRMFGLCGIALSILAGLVPSLGAAQPAQPPGGVTTQPANKTRFQPPTHAVKPPPTSNDKELEAARKAALQNQPAQPTKPAEYSPVNPAVKPTHSEPVTPHGAMNPNTTADAPTTGMGVLKSMTVCTIAP